MHAHQIRLFGKVCIQSIQETPINLPAKAQELLFYLLLHQDHPHTRESLAGLLWGDTSATLSKKYLRQNLWQLQVALGSQLHAYEQPVLLLNRDWVQVNADANLWLDTRLFDRAFSVVRDIRGQHFNSQQIRTLQEAIELYQGELLIGWYQNWCLVERERFQSMFFAMLDKLMDYCLFHHQFENGIEYGMRILRYDYTHEKTHRQLMRLYHLSGNRTAALRQFELCAATLAQEFNINPTERTIGLFEQIRADQPADRHPLDSEDLSMQGEATRLLPKVLGELKQIHLYLSSLQRDIESMKRTLNKQT